MNCIDQQRIQAAVRELLLALGDDPERDGLIKTPERVARMYTEILDGIHDDPRRHLEVQFKENGHNEMIIVRDIPFASICEHHLMPFLGRAHVAYIPQNGMIIGLSKIARVVDGYAHRLQLQERLTANIADAMVDTLKPQGVMVMLEAEHMCMTVRGVKKPGSLTVTSAVRGIFHRAATRSEALNLIRHGG